MFKKNSGEKTGKSNPQYWAVLGIGPENGYWAENGDLVFTQRKTSRKLGNVVLGKHCCPVVSGNLIGKLVTTDYSSKN